MGKLLWTPPITSPLGDFGGRRAPRRLGWGTGAAPRSRPTVGGEDRNNGRRHLAEDLRGKKNNPLFTATAWATSPGLLPHASGAEMGSMERPHTSRRPSQPKPEVSSLCYLSPSPPDAVQRDGEPVQDHRRGTSSATEMPLAAPQDSPPLWACAQGWGREQWDALGLEKGEGATRQKGGWAAEATNQMFSLGLQERSTKINQG